MYICIYIYIYINTYIHVYIYTYTHAYVYIYVYACTYTKGWLTNMSSTYLSTCRLKQTTPLDIGTGKSLKFGDCLKR